MLIASWLAHEREKGYPAFDREDIPIKHHIPLVYLTFLTHLITNLLGRATCSTSRTINFPCTLTLNTFPCKGL